jgi:hypothetical protein
MPKTRRDLLLAIADKVGGERGKRMREALERCECLALMDRPITDEEFARQLEKAERDLPRILAGEKPGRELPGTWGFPN